MTTNWPRLFTLLAALAVPGTCLAQISPDVPSNRAGARESEPPVAASGKFLSIPGLTPLSMESVQREIGLSGEQRQKLKAVSDAYAATMQQLGKSFEALSPEDQQNRAKDFGSQAAQRARNAQRRAESILSPHQLQVVEKIAFQLSATGALTDPVLQDKLGLSPEQRQRLTAVFEQAGERMQKLQRDTAAQVIPLLDEEQTAELKKLLEAQKPH